MKFGEVALSKSRHDLVHLVTCIYLSTIVTLSVEIVTRFSKLGETVFCTNFDEGAIQENHGAILSRDLDTI